MPFHIILSIIVDGWPKQFPDLWVVLKATGALAATYLVKRYCGGAMNRADQNMHGRVVIITGGTSGIGAATAQDLARRGAQLVLLTRQHPSDPFLVEYVQDLRARTGNELIYAEQVDLASLHSVRKFATRWIDNAPPRRLDMVVLCAATLTPPGGDFRTTPDGLEETWQVNYLANFHLLGLLSPALRAQPFDRDVRVLLPTCSAYIGSPPLADAFEALDRDAWTPAAAYARSKLALMTFGRAFQKHLDAHKRPDQMPMNARVVFADPGLARTPGTRRWLTRGSLPGLALYLVFYAPAWLLLKSPYMASQSIVYAAAEPALGRGPGPRLVKECMEVDIARKDVADDAVARKLWESSDRLVEKVEKEQAIVRAKEKKKRERRAREERDAKDAKEAKEADEATETESLAGSIRSSKSKGKAKSEPKSDYKSDAKSDTKSKGKGKSDNKAKGKGKTEGKAKK